MTAETLKKSILQYAIEGKLVEQRTEEGTGEDLYKQIQVEKQRLIKEGKIKKQKELPEIIEEDTLFEIPESWSWKYLGDIFSHIAGKALNSKNTKGNKHKYITTSNVYWDHFDLNNLKEMYYTDYEVKKYSVVKGDLLVLEGGDVGRSAIWNLEEKYCVQNHIHRLRPYSEVDVKFFFFVMMYLKESGEIGGKGIGIKGLSSRALHEIQVPLPPLEEQHRIVEKIEELMPYIEDYDASEKELSLLNQEFPDKLKNSILQYAIEGKLVPQDDKEEPARELLKRIKQEKEQLIKEKKIKRDKNESEIYRENRHFYEKIGKNDPVCIDDEIPFDIPYSWEWVRLGDILNITMGQSPEGSSVGTLRNGIEFHQGKVFFSEKYLNVSDKYTNKPSKIAYANSVLLCVRAPVGKINITNREICIGRGLCALQPIGDIDLNFIYYMLKNYEHIFIKQATGSTFKAITVKIIRNQLFPLPPLEEQYRIVEKIEELMPMCDKLKET